MIYAFTSAAANYVPKLRLLCNSIHKHHPEFRMVLALADRTPSWLADVSQEPFHEIIPVGDLPIPNRNNWIFRHSLVELATGIKPFVLQALLSRPDCEAVLFFDPDIVLFSPLRDLVQELSIANIVLTPHQTIPDKDYEAIIDNEICSLKHGIYNLGFIGVRNTPESMRFARWWGDRLYDFCRADIPAGLFTDQRWIDFAPVFFDGVKILKSSRFNVAPWNLTTRPVSGSLSKGLMVGDEPLGFYHFTGFDSGAHAIMAEKNGGGNRTVRDMVKWYIRETEALDHGDESKTPWAFGRYEHGEPITPIHRKIYRERRDLQQAYPNPFAYSSDHSYPQWLLTQGRLEYPSLLGESAVEDSDKQLVPQIQMSRTGLSKIATRALMNSAFRKHYWRKCIGSLRSGGIRSLMAELRRPLV